jgi:hypothetical protein
MKYVPWYTMKRSSEEISQLTISCPPPGLAAWSQSAPLLPAYSMTCTRDFVARLARASKRNKDIIKETVDAALGDKTLQKQQFMPSHNVEDQPLIWAT